MRLQTVEEAQSSVMQRIKELRDMVMLAQLRPPQGSRRSKPDLPPVSGAGSKGSEEGGGSAAESSSSSDDHDDDEGSSAEQRPDNTQGGEGGSS